MNNLKIEPKSNQNPFFWSWRDVLIVALGIILFGIIALVIGISILILSPGANYMDRMIADEPSIIFSIGAAFLESFALLLGVYVFGIRRNQISWSALGIQPISRKWILISVTLGVLAIPISALITFTVQNLFNLPAENPQLPFLISDDLSPASMFMMVLLIGLIIPIAEELFFRGVLYAWLRQRFGLLVGLLASSAVFGIVHGNLIVASTAFVLGILLALVYEYSGSLWSSILMHAINNGVQLIFLYITLSL